VTLIVISNLVLSIFVVAAVAGICRFGYLVGDGRLGPRSEAAEPSHEALERRAA